MQANFPVARTRNFIFLASVVNLPCSPRLFLLANCEVYQEICRPSDEVLGGILKTNSEVCVYARILFITTVYVLVSFYVSNAVRIDPYHIWSSFL